MDQSDSNTSNLTTRTFSSHLTRQQDNNSMWIRFRVWILKLSLRLIGSPGRTDEGYKVEMTAMGHTLYVPEQLGSTPTARIKAYVIALKEAEWGISRENLKSGMTKIKEALNSQDYTRAAFIALRYLALLVVSILFVGAT